MELTSLSCLAGPDQQPGLRILKHRSHLAPYLGPPGTPAQSCLFNAIQALKVCTYSRPSPEFPLHTLGVAHHGPCAHRKSKAHLGLIFPQHHRVPQGTRPPPGSPKLLSDPGTDEVCCPHNHGARDWQGLLPCTPDPQGCAPACSLQPKRTLPPALCSASYSPAVRCSVDSPPKGENPDLSICSDHAGGQNVNWNPISSFPL